jgi:Putative lumazine-binding
MKKIVMIFLILAITKPSTAQDARLEIERTCMDYIEGFYEGDTLKIISCLKPSLYKLGYRKKEGTDTYEYAGTMPFQGAVAFAKNVYNNKRFAKEGSPKKVEVLDVMNAIAVAKITVWWGTDYLLLSKQNNKWMIEEVLWEGPLQK